MKNQQKAIQNLKWLLAIKPFASVSLAAALLVPFFNQNGLQLTDILHLQMIFSVFVVMWELPSGWLADKFGRAKSVQYGVISAVLGFALYASSHHFALFAVAEILLAVGFGFMSGADNALAYESLKVLKKEQDFKAWRQKGQAIAFAVSGVAAVVGSVLAVAVSIRFVFALEAVTSLLALIFAAKLKEVNQAGKKEPPRRVHVIMYQDILRRREVWSLLLLASTLAASTYFGYWLSAGLYAKAGIPLALFGVLAFTRDGWRSLLSHKHSSLKVGDRTQLRSFVVLSGAVYLLLAIDVRLFLWAVLLHDALQVLHVPIIDHRLNERFASSDRALLNSALNFTRRIGYIVLAPFIGYFWDHKAPHTALVYIGLLLGMTTLAAYALVPKNSLE